jgi:integrase
MPLSDVAIRKIKPTDRVQRVFDEKGMYLEVSPAGGKWWRLKYRFLGKEKRISLGTYPDTTLAAAREKRDAARRQLAAGIDPGEHRKETRQATVERASNSFEVIAREWVSKRSKVWGESHRTKTIAWLEKDLFPWIGGRPIGEITSKELLTTLKRVESRGAIDKAHRLLQHCGQVFRYAVAAGVAERNPAADLRDALATAQTVHRAAITEPKAIGGLLRAIEAYEGGLVVRSALKLAPLVFVRPGELRTAEWTEIDLEKAEWNLPASKMKMREPHLVPLSTQAVAVLQEIRALTGRGRYVFPSSRSPRRPMSDNAVLSALRIMGYPKDVMSGHGFRAMARTVLDEVLGYRTDYIEQQLAHAVKDPTGRAYNRTKHLTERRQMMQGWADYLEGLRDGGNVIALGRKLART